MNCMITPLLRGVRGVYFEILLMFLFIFFACPKKTNQKKRHFIVRYFLKNGRKNRSLKTIFQKLNFLQGFKNF